MPEESVVARQEPRQAVVERQEQVASPLVVDLGKHKRKRIKDLRRGRGKLMDEVSDVLIQLRSEGVVAGSTQPVVVVVREKRRSRSSRWMGL